MNSSENSPESSSGKIKNRIDYYADCFLDIAKAEGEVDAFEEEFRLLKDAVINNLDLKKFLTDPSIEKPEKIRTAFKILDSSSTNAVRAALATMITMDAIESINEIYNKFVMLVNKLKTQILVEVVSAVSIDKKLLNEIKKNIDEKTGLDSRLKNIIDKSIIGGLLIKIGDRQIDLSIKSKINDLKTRLRSLELGGGEFVSSNKD
ncbi:MAG: ATP synthase F1 subunit delta [Actinobacteria bacterium]|nr:ATP synthase F1 subunit delta [Actinomycetota bacterium]